MYLDVLKNHPKEILKEKNLKKEPELLERIFKECIYGFRDMKMKDQR